MGRIGEAWAVDADLGNRDPNELNQHLQITYEEVIGEPDHTHSIDCVWTYSYKCFNLWKTLCYIILTTICGIPIATCWGCYFACIAFCHIWQVMPCIAAMLVNCAVVKRVYSILTDTCISPCCDAFSKLFAPFAK